MELRNESSLVCLHAYWVLLISESPEGFFGYRYFMEFHVSNSGDNIDSVTLVNVKAVQLDEGWWLLLSYYSINSIRTGMLHPGA